jgi:hypothetical protein
MGSSRPAPGPRVRLQVSSRILPRRPLGRERMRPVCSRLLLRRWDQAPVSERHLFLREGSLLRGVSRRLDLHRRPGATLRPRDILDTCLHVRHLPQRLRVSEREEGGVSCRRLLPRAIERVPKLPSRLHLSIRRVRQRRVVREGASAVLTFCSLHGQRIHLRALPTRMDIELPAQSLHPVSCRRSDAVRGAASLFILRQGFLSDPQPARGLPCVSHLAGTSSVSIDQDEGSHTRATKAATRCLVALADLPWTTADTQ